MRSHQEVRVEMYFNLRMTIPSKKSMSLPSCLVMKMKFKRKKKKKAKIFSEIIWKGNTFLEYFSSEFRLNDIKSLMFFFFEKLNK